MLYWSEDEDATLRRMAADRRSSRQIAAVVKRSRNSVISRAHRLGVALEGGPGGAPRSAWPRRSRREVAAARARDPGPPLPATRSVAPARKWVGEPPETRDVPLLEVTDRACRWPTDSGLACGRSVDGTGSRYCDYHHWLGVDHAATSQSMRRARSRKL